MRVVRAEAQIKTAYVANCFHAKQHLREIGSDHLRAEEQARAEFARRELDWIDELFGGLLRARERGARIGLQRAHHVGEAVGIDEIVAVDEDDVLAASQPERLVAVAVLADVHAVAYG